MSRIKSKEAKIVIDNVLGSFLLEHGFKKKNFRGQLNGYLKVEKNSHMNIGII